MFQELGNQLFAISYTNKLKKNIRKQVVVRLGSSNAPGSTNNLIHYEKNIWNLEFKKINLCKCKLSSEEAFSLFKILLTNENNFSKAGYQSKRAI